MTKEARIYKGEIVVGKLDIYMLENEIRNFSNTIPKNKID